MTYAARSEARKATTLAISAGRAEAADRDLREILGRGAVVAVDVAQPFGVDAPGSDRVHRDPLGAELAGEGLEPADHPGADGVREGEVRDRLADRGGLDRDDPAAPARAQVGERVADERHVRGEHQRDGLLDDLGGQLGRLAGAWAAAVQDEHVDAAEGADRHLDEALEVLRDRQVALDGEAADPLRLAFQHVSAAREHRDVGALGGERLRGREAHAGRGATDDCRAPGESQLHAGTLARVAFRHREGSSATDVLTRIGIRHRFCQAQSVSIVCRSSTAALGRRQAVVVSTSTTSRTAAVEARSIFFSSAVSLRRTISSTPAAPSRTGTPM